MTYSRVTKASNIIHISHNLTLTQHRLYDFMLAHASPHLTTQKEHAISLAMLRSALSTSRNCAHIEDSLLAMTSLATYVVIDKQRSDERGFFPFLSSVRFENGICYYAYAPLMVAMLDQPRMFAKINLLVQKKMRSKYSLALYELCIDYIGIAMTPRLSIEKLRAYLAIGADEYPTFGVLNQKVLQRSIREINKVSDITIQMMPYYAGKYVAGVIFKMAYKPKTSVPLPTYPPAKRVPEPDVHQKLLSLEIEFKSYREKRIGEFVDSLNVVQHKQLEVDYNAWLSNHTFLAAFMSGALARTAFLETLLLPEDRDFITFAAKRGVKIERVNKQYRIVG